MQETPDTVDRPVVVITGAAGAVGRATSLRFAQEGYSVCLTDVAEDKLVDLTNSLSKLGATYMSMPCDLSDDASVKNLVEQTAVRFGRIDHMVYCAGIRPTGALDLDKTAQDLQACFDINVMGTYRCSVALLPYLTASNRASIVIFSSAAGTRVNAFMAAYCTSKAAIHGLVGVMAAEWSELGIRINAIAPAQIESEMIAEQVGAERKRREERLPIGRYAKGEEMAATALFLAGPESSFITGSTLYADGGYTNFGFRPERI